MYEVIVRFMGSYNNYTFKCDFPVENGDRVLCDTSRGIQIGTVYSAQKVIQPSALAKKWIFQKLNLSALEMLLERDKEKANREKRIKEVTSRLKKMVEEHSYLELFETVASADPRAKELLAELKELQNG